MIPHCHELWLGRRRGSDPAVLWLRCRLAAVALIRPLDWELSYTTDVALKSKKRKEIPGKVFSFHTYEIRSLSLLTSIFVAACVGAGLC